MRRSKLRKRYGHASRTRRADEVVLTRNHRGMTIEVIKAHGVFVPRIYKGGRLEETLPFQATKFGALERAARTIDAMLGD